MSSSRLNGALSPPLQNRSGATSPRQKFPADSLRPFVKSVSTFIRHEVDLETYQARSSFQRRRAKIRQSGTEWDTERRADQWTDIPVLVQILAKTLSSATWDSTDKLKMAAYSKEISERVKLRMIEIEPRGFKYIVTATLTENLGQAGRADMSCHWEDTDAAVQEMFSNDSIIFVCVAFAVRVI